MLYFEFDFTFSARGKLLLLVYDYCCYELYDVVFLVVLADAWLGDDLLDYSSICGRIDRASEGAGVASTDFTTARLPFDAFTGLADCCIGCVRDDASVGKYEDSEVFFLRD